MPHGKKVYVENPDTWLVSMRIHAPEGRDELNYVMECFLKEVPGFREIRPGKKRGDTYTVMAEVGGKGYFELQEKIDMAGDYVRSAKIKWPRREWKAEICVCGKQNARDGIKRVTQRKDIDIHSISLEDGKERVSIGFTGTDPKVALDSFGEQADFIDVQPGEIDYGYNPKLIEDFYQEPVVAANPVSPVIDCDEEAPETPQQDRERDVYFFEESYLTVDGKRLPYGIRLKGLGFKRLNDFLTVLEAGPFFPDGHDMKKVELHYRELGSKKRYPIIRRKGGRIFTDHHGKSKDISELPNELGERLENRRKKLKNLRKKRLRQKKSKEGRKRKKKNK